MTIDLCSRVRRFLISCKLILRFLWFISLQTLPCVIFSNPLLLSFPCFSCPANLFFLYKVPRVDHFYHGLKGPLMINLNEWQVKQHWWSVMLELGSAWLFKSTVNINLFTLNLKTVLLLSAGKQRRSMFLQQLIQKDERRTWSYQHKRLILKITSCRANLVLSANPLTRCVGFGLISHCRSIWSWPCR